MKKENNEAMYRMDSWADNLYAEAKSRTIPIDLHAIARFRGIKKVEMKLIVHRSALAPEKGGFSAYIRALEARELPLEAEEPEGLLTVRQRLAFAHEIAHTLFYRLTGGVPVATGEVHPNPDLEEICERGAKRILVPRTLLRAELEARLDSPEQIDLDFLREMAKRFRVSHHVMMERLRVVYTENSFSRCIALVKNNEGVHEVAATYVGLGLVSAFRSAEDYPVLSEWFPEFPLELVNSAGESTLQKTVRGRKLKIRRLHLSRSGDFLLQIDDLEHLAPTSK